MHSKLSLCIPRSAFFPQLPRSSARSAGGFAGWRFQNPSSNPRCLDSVINGPAWPVRWDLGEVGPGRWSSSSAAGLQWFAAAGNRRRTVHNHPPRAGRRNTARKAPPMCSVRGVLDCSAHVEAGAFARGIRYPRFRPPRALNRAPRQFLPGDCACCGFPRRLSASSAGRKPPWPPRRWPGVRRVGIRKPRGPCTMPASPKVAPRPPENIAQIP